MEEQLRLHKFLAAQGIASRRAAEAMIAQGRVAVNGRVVTEQGISIRPARDRVTVDGQDIAAPERRRYILLNKPRGYICSNNDERGRRIVLDLLNGVTERVYPVGRLDYDTAGLLLLTNDGELANQLLHPSRQVDKVYVAEVAEAPTEASLRKLREGVRLTDGLTAPAGARLKGKRGDNYLVELTIHEGRNHQIKRMLEAAGHPVLRLQRVKLAFLDLTGLQVGQWRDLTPSEIKRLKTPPDSKSENKGGKGNGRSTSARASGKASRPDTGLHRQRQG